MGGVEGRYKYNILRFFFFCIKKKSRPRDSYSLKVPTHTEQSFELVCLGKLITELGF